MQNNWHRSDGVKRRTHKCSAYRYDSLPLLHPPFSFWIQLLFPPKFQELCCIQKRYLGIHQQSQEMRYCPSIGMVCFGRFFFLDFWGFLSYELCYIQKEILDYWPAIVSTDAALSLFLHIWLLTIYFCWIFESFWGFPFWIYFVLTHLECIWNMFCLQRLLMYFEICIGNIHICNSRCFYMYFLLRVFA